MTMNRRRYVGLWIDGSNMLMAGAALIQRYRRGLVTWDYLMSLSRDEGHRHRQIAPAIRIA